jgi:hypothetical protein
LIWPAALSSLGVVIWAMAPPAANGKFKVMPNAEQHFPARRSNADAHHNEPLLEPIQFRA